MKQIMKKLLAVYKTYRKLIFLNLSAILCLIAFFFCDFYLIKQDSILSIKYLIILILIKLMLLLSIIINSLFIYHSIYASKHKKQVNHKATYISHPDETYEAKHKASNKKRIRIKDIWEF